MAQWDEEFCAEGESLWHLAVGELTRCPLAEKLNLLTVVGILQVLPKLWKITESRFSLDDPVFRELVGELSFCLCLLGYSTHIC